MAEFALLMGGTFREFRHYDERPENIPHKQIEWLPVVHEFGEPFEGVDGDQYVVRAIDPSTLPPPVPPSISDRQFFQQLAVMSLITEQEAEDAMASVIPASMIALVEMLPEADRHPARMLLKGAVEFHRGHPLTAVIAQLYGFTEQQVDDLFRDASAL